MASQCVPLAVCGTAFTIRVAERLIRGRMSDGYTPRNEGIPLECEVSAPCPFLKFCGNSAQLIYTHKVIIFEVQQTRHSFGQWLVKLKFHSYISLVGERNVTFGGGTVGCEIEQQHEIPRCKHALCYFQPRVRVTYV